MGDRLCSLRNMVDSILQRSMYSTEHSHELQLDIPDLDMLLSNTTTCAACVLQKLAPTLGNAQHLVPPEIVAS